MNTNFKLRILGLNYFLILAHAALYSSKNYDCGLPDNMSDYSLITKGDADVAAHNVYSGMVIGGKLSDPFPRSSIAVNGKTFCASLRYPNGFNFNGGVKRKAQLGDVVDFDHFEWLARNAVTSRKGQYKVIVLNEGGTFNLYDFRNGGQGEDNGKTLVVFNTPDKVILTKTRDGRQFGPSIIAPFSTVILQDQAGFIDGFVVAKDFRTMGRSASQLQMHGDTYKGPIQCRQLESIETSRSTESPSKIPTDAPTKIPTKLLTKEPTYSPTTDVPTEIPTKLVTKAPTNSPTILSTKTPTNNPTAKVVYEAGGVKPSGARGDPHFRTWTGEIYDFHGVCDLVLLQNPGFENGLGMDIHMRTKKARQWSYISTSVIRIGDDTFEVMAEKKQTKYWINGVMGEEIFHDMTLTTTISGYPIQFKNANSQQKEYRIDLGQDEAIIFKTWHDMVRVDIIGATAEKFASSVGLMGTFKSGLKMARDNVTIIDNVNDFGQEWQVLPTELILFHNIDGPQAPNKCVIPSQAQLRRNLAESSITLEASQQACAGIADKDDFDLCVFDILATNDIGAVGAY